MFNLFFALTSVLQEYKRLIVMKIKSVICSLSLYEQNNFIKLNKVNRKVQIRFKKFLLLTHFPRLNSLSYKLDCPENTHAFNEVTLKENWLWTLDSIIVIISDQRSLNKSLKLILRIITVT